MNELLPSFKDDDADAVEGGGGGGDLPNGHVRAQSDAGKLAEGGPLFPEVDSLLALFKDSCTELVDLRHQVCD